MKRLVAVRRILSIAPIVVALLIALCVPSVSGQIINTVAGGGTRDGGPATGAFLNNPAGATFDSAGNLYFADFDNHRVRKVNTSGIISTVAGNGAQGFSGDGGPAFSASLDRPTDVAIDSSGNLYIADAGNVRIRKVDTRGIISTVVGTGTVGFSGDGGAATSADLNLPRGLAIDSAGNLYIADLGNQRIRKVNTSGIIITVAGTGIAGFSGDGGAATSARLGSPASVAVDSAGNLYVADYDNARIRKVSTNGTISTAAGTGSRLFNGDGRIATSANLGGPWDLAIDSAGNLYISDYADQRIRKVNTSGIISTVAGTGEFGFSGDGGAATHARLNFPQGVAIDSAGNLIIADTGNHRIRKVNTSGVISTSAGSDLNGTNGDGGTATSARLIYPVGVAIDGANNLYISDYENHRIRKVNANGIISTVAGNGVAGFSGDGGAATNASFNYPSGIAIDSAGNLYIADGVNNRVRRVDTSGIVSTVAGNGVEGFSGDGGAAVNSSLRDPQGLSIDSAGNLYIADSRNNRVRKVDTRGTISTVAGNGVEGFSGDGGAAVSSSLSYPQAVSIDFAGNLYIADSANGRIRRVNTSGIISTVAGNGLTNLRGDGGPAISARFRVPNGLAVDRSGNLYIVDMLDQRIRMVSANGTISTVAGNSAFAFSGDGGIATNASLNYPRAVAVDSVGSLYIADSRNYRIRKVTTGTQISNYQGAWWAGAAENGWGLSLIQHGQTLAAGWYYFNAQGQPTWAIVPGCAWNAANTVCTGNVLASTGSWLGNYTGILTQNVIGTVTFSFTSATTGTMSWNIGGVPGTKSISLLNYASGASPSGIDYTDIWWAGTAQNGWGVALLQQGGVLAGSWYTYNQQNQPVWYLINGGTWTGSNGFTAPLTRATGSPLIGSTYNPALLNTSTVGTVTFTFTDGANATMSYTVDGVTQTKSITRLAF